MKSLMYFAFVAIIITGCSASGRKYVKDSSHAYPSLAKLTIYREHAEPTAYPATIKIDNQDVVSLKQKGFTTVYVKPGQRTILADWPAFSGQPNQTFILDAKSNYEYYVTLVGRYRAVVDKKLFNSKRRLPGEEKMSMQPGTISVFVNNTATVVDLATLNGTALALISNEVAEDRLTQCCYEQQPLKKQF
jgi:hypothetical protein